MVTDKSNVLERTLTGGLEPEADTLGESFFPSFISNLLKRHQDKKISINNVDNSIKNALSIEILINNLAEVFRLSKKEVEQDLEDFGFKELIDQYRLKNMSTSGAKEQQTSPLSLSNNPEKLNPFPDLFKIHSSPSVLEPVSIDNNLQKIFVDLFNTIPNTFKDDPFVKSYREDVIGYYNGFMSDVAPRIKQEIANKFDGKYPKYMVTTGIGANEQFTHFSASINNHDKERRLKWLVIDSPKNLPQLPEDATIENTLYVEFSRSSLTEETVKIHEYTPRNAKRIVFSNKGPLREIAQRDNNLILELPDHVSGRFGRNTTPTLLAPMFIAGMDVEKFWKDIDLATKTFNISDPNSLPFVLAKFILIHQKLLSKNFIYLGCNDDGLGFLADEFIQFWNEGVNKSGNDLLISRFFGLPRDSHMNIEGVLGNQMTKMGIFLLRTNMRVDKFHPMVSLDIDPINPEHRGLRYGDEEVVLAVANYKRFSELMPSFLIEVPCEPTLRHAAILGQLFADVTFIYSRLNGIDPGSNPEVKFVRERSANLLAGAAKKIRDNNLPIEKAIF